MSSNDMSSSNYKLQRMNYTDYIINHLYYIYIDYPGVLGF